MKKIPTNENRMTAEAWCAVVHGVAKSWTRLSDWTKLSWKPSKIIKTFYGVFQITFQIYVSNCSNLGNLAEKAMAPHSSTLAWKIPWTEEPGGLQSMGYRRVGHDWATSLSCFTLMHWRRKWQPTPDFLPGESQGRGSLVGCRLWGRTESDTTEAT